MTILKIKKRTLNEAYIKCTGKVHRLVSRHNGIQESKTIVLGIINSNNFSHTAGLRIFLSPNMTNSPHLWRPLCGLEHLAATPIPHPTSQPKSPVFLLLHCLFAGGPKVGKEEEGGRA